MEIIVRAKHLLIMRNELIYGFYKQMLRPYGIKVAFFNDYITDTLKYQIYSNLRTALEGSLSDKNGQKFIQSDGSKNYRISTHPDFIT
ncbi:MAG: hypothetical protein QG641_2124 [Candidatus Poribacteria bacterium]|nr:hypothetical protein [Candidatus Poribacteria bacterium]